MTMKILIVEDNPSLTLLYRDAFSALMPEARVDIVASVGGFLRNASETRYDAYVMDDTIADGRRAFSEIAPLVQRRFPGAVILHNSSRIVPEEIETAERLEKIRFARGPDGRVVTCGKNFTVIMEYLRTMVVPREERMAKTSGHNSAPFCQRCVPAPKPQLTCCRI